MKKQEAFSPAAVGGSSLLVIFAVLCLTVFALLSLSSVQAERRLADAATQSVVDYYEADLQAQQIFAWLRAGEQIPGLDGKDGTYEFEIPISGQQVLSVALAYQEENWVILRWQAVTGETEADNTLDVWKGSEDKS